MTMQSEREKEPYVIPWARPLSLPLTQDLLVNFSAEADFDDFEFGEEL